jgi:hypothetical protein
MMRVVAVALAVLASLDVNDERFTPLVHSCSLTTPLDLLLFERTDETAHRCACDARARAGLETCQWRLHVHTHDEPAHSAAAPDA